MAWTKPNNIATKIYYVDRTIQNGWRTRLELRPRGYLDGDFPKMYYVEIPASLFDVEIKTKAEYDGLPYGLIDNKSMTLRINLQHLQELIEEYKALLDEFNPTPNEGENGKYDDLYEKYTNLKDFQYYVLNPIHIITGSPRWFGDEPFEFVDSNKLRTVRGYEEDTYVYNTWCLYSDRGESDLDWPDVEFTYNYNDPMNPDYVTSGSITNDFYPEFIGSQTQIIGEKIDFKTAYEYEEIVLQDSIITAMNTCRFTDLYRILDKHYCIDTIESKYMQHLIQMSLNESGADSFYLRDNIYDLATAFTFPLNSAFMIMNLLSLDHFYYRMFEYIYKVWECFVFRDRFFCAQWTTYNEHTSDDLLTEFKEHPLYKHIFHTQSKNTALSTNTATYNWNLESGEMVRKDTSETPLLYLIYETYRRNNNGNREVNYAEGGLFGRTNGYKDKGSLVQLYEDNIYKFLVDNLNTSGYCYKLKYEKKNGKLCWFLKPKDIRVDTTEGFILNNSKISLTNIQKNYMVPKSIKATIKDFSTSSKVLLNPEEKSSNKLLSDELNLGSYNFTTNNTASFTRYKGTVLKHYGTLKYMVTHLNPSYNFIVQVDDANDIANNDSVKYIYKLYDDVTLDGVKWDGSKYIVNPDREDDYRVTTALGYGVISQEEWNRRANEQIAQSNYGNGLCLMLMKKFCRKDQILVEGELFLKDSLTTNGNLGLLTNDVGITGTIKHNINDNGFDTIIQDRYNVKNTIFRLLSSEVNWKDCKVSVKLYMQGDEDPMINT